MLINKLQSELLLSLLPTENVSRTMYICTQRTFKPTRLCKSSVGTLMHGYGPFNFDSWDPLGGFILTQYHFS